MTNLTHCLRCSRPFSDFATQVSTGYGTTATGERVCFSCCALIDSEEMEKTGRITLYLDDANANVVNWPGTLKFGVRLSRRSWHNIGRERIDVWFKDAQGKQWHGIHIGTNNTLVRCRRLKDRRKASTVARAVA